MPNITIGEDTFKRIKEFQQVIEAVTHDEMDLNTCAEVILIRGLDLMLAEFLGPLDHDTLLLSLQKLAALFPDKVCWFVSDAIKRGRPIPYQGNADS